MADYADIQQTIVELGARARKEVTSQRALVPEKDGQRCFFEAFPRELDPHCQGSPPTAQKDLGEE